MTRTSVRVGVAFVTGFMVVSAVCFSQTAGGPLGAVAYAAGVEQNEDQPARVAWTLDAMQAEWGGDHGWTWIDKGPRLNFPDEHVWDASNVHVPECRLTVIAVGQRVKNVTAIIVAGEKDTDIRIYTGITVAGLQINRLTGMPSERIALWFRWCLDDDIAAWSEDRNGGPQAIERDGYRLNWQTIRELGAVMITVAPVKGD